MKKFDIKDILLSALTFKAYGRDKVWSRSNEWVVIIPVLGSEISKRLDWSPTYDGHAIKDREILTYLGNTFHIWFDFYDYNDPKDVRYYIVSYLEGCEKYIFKPTEKSMATAWFKPYAANRKKILSFNEKLTGNSVDGEAEEVQPR